MVLRRGSTLEGNNIALTTIQDRCCSKHTYDANTLLEVLMHAKINNVVIGFHNVIGFT